MEMITVHAEDQKRIDTILKIWNYFGPSEKNMGEHNVAPAEFLLNRSMLVDVSTEIGPYVTVIYPQMIEYFSNIFNKLYDRGRHRMAKDFGINVDLIPDIKLPNRLILPPFVPEPRQLFKMLPAPRDQISEGTVSV